MSDRPLPRPVSSTDLYLAAILGELQQLNAPPPADDTGLVDLREPAAEVSLPDDLPGRDQLFAAGYTTLESVPRKGKELTAVSGIGPVTANQILTWLKVNS